MRYWLLLLLLHGFAISKAQLTDDFSDGDFTNNPTWTGQVMKFQVVNNALQLNNASITDEAYLVTPALTRDSTYWSFFVALDFAPSNNNNVRYYLKSKQPDLTGPLRGYFIRIGENGSQDGVDLYRQDGTTTTKILDGLPGTAFDDPVFQIEVIQDAEGEWHVYADSGALGNPVLQGSVIDTTYRLGSYVGVFCKHTTSNNTAFTFDDIVVGPLFVDTLPPTIVDVIATDATTVEVYYDEKVDPATATLPANYTIDGGIGAPQSAMLDAGDSSHITLTVSTPLTNATTYQLTATGVADQEGNVAGQLVASFTYYVPAPGDILINEIMADPSPSQGWPEEEYVELYNTLSVPISLQQWAFSDGGTTGNIPPVTIPPQGYVLLADESAIGQFPASLPLVGLDPWPALNNDGDNLALLAPDGSSIDAVSYTDNWYADPDKEGGGWSLELLDPASNCPGRTNWRASRDNTGGTPGAANSWLGQFVDTTGPAIISYQLLDPSTLELFFDGALDTASVQVTDFQLTPGAISPNGLTYQGVNQDALTLTFSAPLDTGQLYQMVITDVSDCRGNPLPATITLSLLIPAPLEQGDLVINEILFNPRSGEVDYLEILNTSEKVVAVAGLQIDELDPVMGDVLDDAQISDTALIRPGGYAAFTSDRQAVLLGYATPNPYRVIDVSGFPNFPNEEGAARIVSREGLTLDSIYYHEDWHFALIDDLNGVSLERIDPDAESTQQNNWYSASSTVGYGTPAYQNSQFRQVEPFEGTIVIEPETVSPDGDGYQDQLVIQYQFTAPGYVGTVQIMDAKGRVVRYLLRSELLEQSGTLIWDGIMDNGRKADMGIYIVYFEVFNLSGETKRFKKRCVVAARP